MQDVPPPPLSGTSEQEGAGAPANTLRMLAKLLVPLVLAVVVAAPSAAAPVGAAVVSAASEAGCLMVAGASNEVGTSRARWLFNFYPEAPAMTPAGLCPEDRPHVEPPVVCAVIEATDEGTVLYLAARAGNGPTWLLRAVDGAQGDAFGIAQGAQTEDRCGAADVHVDIASGIAAIAAAG